MPLSIRYLVLSALLFSLLPGPTLAFADQNESGSESENPTNTTADVIDHQAFDELLSSFVDSRGMVDYARWARSPAAIQKLSRYVRAIGTASPEGFSETSQLAFYLNAYNALVIHDVIRRWPVETVINIDGFFDGKKHTIAGRELTLNELEHDEIIRVQFEEPRIHFVLVCAAVDCPRLRRDAFTAANLERELRRATSEFLRRSTTLKEGKVITSQLFNWYGEDFVKHSGSLRRYLIDHLPAGEVREALRADAPIEFGEYDWAINKQ